MYFFLKFIGETIGPSFTWIKAKSRLVSFMFNKLAYSKNQFAFTARRDTVIYCCVTYIIDEFEAPFGFDLMSEILSNIS